LDRAVLSADARSTGRIARTTPDQEVGVDDCAIARDCARLSKKCVFTIARDCAGKQLGLDKNQAARRREIKPEEQHRHGGHRLSGQ